VGSEKRVDIGEEREMVWERGGGREGRGKLEVEGGGKEGEGWDEGGRGDEEGER